MKSRLLFFILTYGLLAIFSYKAIANINEAAAVRQILPEVLDALLENSDSSSLDNPSKENIARALEIAHEEDHLKSLQYVYWLELRRLFTIRDKVAYKAVLDKVDQLDTSLDEFQANLWVRKAMYYELDRDANYLREQVPLLKKAVSIFKQRGNLEKYWSETIRLSGFLRVLSQLDESLTLLDGMESDLKQSDENMIKVRFYAERGLNYYYRSEQNKAIEDFEEGVKYASLLDNNANRLATLYSHLGMSYSAIGRSDIAVDFFEKSHQSVLDSPDSSKSRIAKSYGNLAIAYQRNEQYDKAIESNQKSLDIRNEIDDKHGVAICYINIGNLYKVQNKVDQAIEYYQLALAIYRKLGYDEGIASTALLLAQTFVQTNTMLNEAKTLIDEAFLIAEKAKRKSLVLELQSLYYILKKKEKQWEEATGILEKYVELYKEIFNEKSQESLSKMQALYENEKQANQILELEQEKEIAAAELEMQKYVRYVLVLGVLLAFVFIYFFYYRYKQKDRFNQRMVKKNEELKKAYEELDRVARFDPLTSVYNRRAMQEFFDLEVARTKRNKSTMSIVLCDIDFFKSINDDYGHDCGDYVLTHVAVLIKQSLRENDILCRWGGEEFLIMMPETDIEKSRRVAERIRDKIDHMNIAYKMDKDKQELHVTLTFGCAQFDESEDIAKTIKRADDALYEGKEAGRNRVI
ncbi:MAG: GGDEF domain-containing protein [Gammaproteobacteria bacterium]|nr:GGDEF domain-containing protein [Gammaproteobacteria bacterium]